MKKILLNLFTENINNVPGIKSETSHMRHMLYYCSISAVLQNYILFLGGHT